MDVQFYGANCLAISTKQARLVIDDNLSDLGAKSVSRDGDVSLFTGVHASPSHKSKLVVDQPGEYEVSGVSIFGIAARSHMDGDDQKSATIYKIVTDDLSLLITGHIYPELSDAQLEAIGAVDIMFVPVGGNGYTMDAIGALNLLKKIDPRLVVPTYYDDPKLKFEVPAQTLDEALKALAMEPKETTTKLKIKPAELGETTQLVVLEKA